MSETVGRCATCKWWIGQAGNIGECRLHDEVAPSDSKRPTLAFVSIRFKWDRPEGVTTAFVTTPDFGCVQHEPITSP